MLVLIDVVLVADDLPRAVLGRQPRLGDPVYEPLVLQPVRHDLRDGDEREPMLFGEPLELGAARAGAVVVQDLADHARRVEPREPREIHGGLGVPHALEHAALARTERKDVPAVSEIAGRGRRIDRDANRRRAVLRADPRGHAKARRRVDADRVRRSIIVEVRLAHRREAELVHTLAGQRDTNQPSRFPNHEVDHLWGDELRRANEVALVLAVFVVGNDNELAAADVVYGLLDCPEFHEAIPCGFRHPMSDIRCPMVVIVVAHVWR